MQIASPLSELKSSDTLLDYFEISQTDKDSVSPQSAAADARLYDNPSRSKQCQELTRVDWAHDLYGAFCKKHGKDERCSDNPPLRKLEIHEETTALQDRIRELNHQLEGAELKAALSKSKIESIEMELAKSIARNTSLEMEAQIQKNEIVDLKGKLVNHVLKHGFYAKSVVIIKF